MSLFRGEYPDLGSFTSTSSGTSGTQETTLGSLSFDTGSTFLTGTNISYSSARGSSALKLDSTFRGATGGFSSIYSKVTNKGAFTTDNDGIIGIKGVVVNDQTLTDGNIYAAQFIAKHSHATKAMANEAALIGLEANAYIAAAGGAGTAIGLNAVIRNEATGGTYAGGAVHRGIQVVCDNSAGGNNPSESTGIAIWNMAGAHTNVLNVVNSGSGFTYFAKFTDDGAPATNTGTTSGSEAGFILVQIGATAKRIKLFANT